MIRISCCLFLLCINLVTCAVENRCKFPYHQNEGKALDKLKADALLGKKFTTSGKAYNFTLGICTDVHDSSDINQCDAVVQDQIDGEHKHWVLGRCNNTDVHAGSDWVQIQYLDGDKYQNACGHQNRRTIVMISCNCSAPDDGVLTYFEEDVERNNDSCYYMFEIETKLICQFNCSAPPTTPITPITTTSIIPAELHGLSGGSIFLIIFFSVFGCYLIVGFVVKFCTGHYGIESIPNAYFWMSFFNLVADGCDYVFRCGPYADSGRSLRIDGDFGGNGGELGFGGHGSMSTQRRGPLTPPPSALPPATPSLSEASSGYQQFNSLNKNQRPISTTGSLTGEAGSLASTSDDTYLIQA